ncbi:MAG: hypothetical protein D6744_05315 [Planctomycetota bacterium]|nr:MAG: hypothetical protein D6744_05315 [Planctomycetota bacterium]
MVAQSSTAIPSRSRRLRAAAVVCVLLLAGAALWAGLRSGDPKRFGTVAEGMIYRCGEVSPDQLARLHERLNLHSVLSLLNDSAPVTVAERAAAERLGLRWFNVPLTGDGASTPEDRARIRQIVLDPANYPLLVHCAAGANRTGLAIGIYRLHHDHWTLEQVLDEMRAYGFEDEPHHENLRAALAAEAVRTTTNDERADEPRNQGTEGGRP